MLGKGGRRHNVELSVWPVHKIERQLNEAERRISFWHEYSIYV